MSNTDIEVPVKALTHISYILLKETMHLIKLYQFIVQPTSAKHEMYKKKVKVIFIDFKLNQVYRTEIT